MDITDIIKQKAQEALSGVNSCHEWEHTERVHAMAVRIGKKLGADMEVLELAALLHDIARKAQDESAGAVDHAKEGAAMAQEILEDLRVSAGTVARVCDCIANHRYRGNAAPQALEARILYDADKLDAIGAIGIGRAFSFAGHFGAKVHNKGVDISVVEPYTADDTAWREYEVKLRHIRDKMLTEPGKRIARERHAFMERFFDQLNKEVDGEI